MPDLARSGDDHQLIIKDNTELQLRVLLTDIAEKKNIVRSLIIEIDGFEQVRIPRLKVKRDCILTEIGLLEQEATGLQEKIDSNEDAIDAEFSVTE